MTPKSILAHDGIEQPITEWALDYGITPAIIIARLERGETVADALTTPMAVTHCGQQLPIFHAKQRIPKRRKRNPRVLYTLDGRTMNLSKWARHCDVNAATVRNRIAAGWPLDVALTARPNSTDARHGPGVVSNFQTSKGTGAGSTAQETPNITFSGEDA